MAADLTTTTPSFPKSPNFHRKKLPSPWTQVVRSEPDPASSLLPDFITASMNPPAVTEVVAAAVVVSEETSDFSNDNVAKKSVWKSVNGVVETGTVMGGAAWPTISESTRACPKVSPNFSKPSSDGLISVSQVRYSQTLLCYCYVAAFIFMIIYLCIFDMFCVIV